MTAKLSKSRRTAYRPTLSVTTLLLLSACAAGPDFQTPSPISSRHYDPQAEARLAANPASGGRPKIHLTGKLADDWWAYLGSAKLDRVMRKAIDSNLDLAAADATIAQANQAVAAAAGGLKPQLDFGAHGGRQGLAGSASNVYAVGPTVSFDFDIFGGKKRLVEERAALADFQRHRYDAAYLTLTGDIAHQALILASSRAQIAAIERLIEQDQKTLALVRAGHRFGGATQVDVALATTQLSQDQTLLPPLAQQRDVARHALSVLASQGPADWVPPEFELSDFALPVEIPVNLPSEIARDRSDILEAEAQLHAANAAIGVATADLYPHFQLSGSLTAVNPAFSALWSVAGGITGPLFHGGTLQANRVGAVAAYKASLATYRQTIIRSLGQVADMLQAVSHDAEECAAQARSLDAADASLRLNRMGYQAGEIGLLHVLDAQRAYQRALLGQLQARTAQYLDTVQLFVALGGHADGAFKRRPTADQGPAIREENAN